MLRAVAESIDPIHPYVLIPAGGSGTRLWPVSRSGTPKFLVALGGEEPLIVMAVRRALQVTSPDRVRIVTGAKHVDAIRALVEPLGVDQFLVEPSPRDTGAAMALGTMTIGRQDPEAVVLCTPADHVITEDGWASTIGRAVASAQAGKLVTIGIPPRGADTGLGYIHAPALAGADVAAVESFREKPDLETAQGYVDSGEYLWNAGIFAWRADTFATQLAAHAPELAAGVEPVVAGVAADGTLDVDVWEQVPKISIDYALAEPAASADAVSVVAADFGWWDLGTWPTVAAFEASDGAAASADASVAQLDSEGCYVRRVASANGEARPRIALLGVKDLIVIDTGDAILITSQEHGSDVKKLVGELPGLGWDELV